MLCINKLARSSNLKTFLISFFCSFDPFWFIYYKRFSDLTFSIVPCYHHIYTDMGGPKKCQNIYELNKYKNKINTTKFLFSVTLSFVHLVVKCMYTSEHLKTGINMYIIIILIKITQTNFK